jgi:hypothetical protein
MHFNLNTITNYKKKPIIHNASIRFKFNDIDQSSYQDKSFKCKSLKYNLMHQTFNVNENLDAVLLISKC